MAEVMVVAIVTHTVVNPLMVTGALPVVMAKKPMEAVMEVAMLVIMEVMKEVTLWKVTEAMVDMHRKVTELPVLSTAMVVVLMAMVMTEVTPMSMALTKPRYRLFLVPKNLPSSCLSHFMSSSQLFSFF